MQNQSCVGKKLDELQTPAFVVNLNAVKNNCTKMLELASSKSIQLRGHVKTHKTIEGAIIQTGGTKRCIVTSTLAETEFYVAAGFNDILYGCNVLPSHMERNFELAKKLSEYHLMISNKEGFNTLIKKQPPDGKKWSVFLEIDCGYKRTGFSWQNDQSIDVARQCIKHQDKISLKGLYVHCGNSYSGSSVTDVEIVRDSTIDRLKDLKERMMAASIVIENAGIGSTPSCSHATDKYEDLTEIHPGNYVFYDAQQMILKSCNEEDIAGRVVTRVIGHYPDRNQIMVDCGFTALTKQGFEKMNKSYAYVQNHPDLCLSNMTQEIGYIQPRNLEKKLDFEAFPYGSLLYLLPFHSCATAGMHPVYYVHDNNNIIVEEWKPVRGW